MKQRVVLVLSTLLNPSLLIADEITSALDVSTQKAVAEMLVGFRDRGFVKSTIVITHDLSILAPGRRHDPDHVRGQARREGVRRVIVDEPAPPVHADADRLAARGRGPLRRAPARRASRGARRRCLHPPAGCRFRDRCPLATARCAAEPPYRSVGDGPSRRVLGGATGADARATSRSTIASAPSAVGTSVPSTTSASPSSAARSSR